MPRNKIASGHLCRPVEEWPEADQAAWQEAVQGTGPFGPETSGSKWSERSRAKTARGYGRWVGWLSEKALELGGEPPVSEGNRRSAPRFRSEGHLNGLRQPAGSVGR